MAIREVLKMGDPRLLAVSEPVQQFGTAELESLLIDMRDTMQALNGAGRCLPGRLGVVPTETALAHTCVIGENRK